MTHACRRYIDFSFEEKLEITSFLKRTMLVS